MASARHGSQAGHPDSGPGEYENLYGSDSKSSEHEAALTRLEDVFKDRTLLFIGFGMRDKYVMDVLARVLDKFKKYSRTHFALMCDDADGEPAKRLWTQYNIQTFRIPVTERRSLIN
ncbi:MAG: hypothetical protein CMJ78_22685 [Planctomycetaceae bacterium]|nr:hypothetical protein [Planctomycetaceae bacterium]